MYIFQRKLTPSQHTQTPESRNQKKFPPIFCGQKLVGKYFWYLYFPHCNFPLPTPPRVYVRTHFDVCMSGTF